MICFGVKPLQYFKTLHMKKELLYGIFLLVTFSLNAQNVNIPDPVFKNFLVNHYYSTNPMGIGTTIYLDSNHDGEIQVTEAATYTSDIFNHGFFLNSLNVTDLTGIEAFDAIEYINVEFNPQLTSLDVSGCASLKTLRTSNNAFTSLTINNPSLQLLYCSGNPALVTVDLSGCTGLKDINCSNNPALTGVNIDGCWVLEELRLNYNPLMTTLIMGTHSGLKFLQCLNGSLSAIDVSSCSALEYLNCTGNPLTALNLANGNPQSFDQIQANGFPGLTCIQVNNVMVSEYLWANGWYQFDDWASFSTDCSPPGPCIVTIPDATFKAWLTANTAINTNGNGEIECSEAIAYTGAINVDNMNIDDMTGIAEFKNITSLSCNNISMWNFSTLNVSGLTALTTVSCTGNNQFNSLNVSGCTALASFNVDTGNSGGVPLSVNAANCTALTGFTVTQWANLSLDVSGCTALTSLDLDNKNISSLNVANCSALTNLICSNNDLIALNLSGCNALTSVNCSNNSITTLAVNNITPLTNLDCSSNELASLMLFDNPNLSVLNCSDNNLTYLLVSNNPALTKLNCSKNSITYLDVNNNLALTDLNCSFNSLTSQNVSANTALTSFSCGHNNLSAINVSQNAALKTLYCDHNNLSAVNLSSNTALISLYIDNNHLTSLDVHNNVNLKTLSCSTNQLTALNLNGISLVQLSCNDNLLTTIDLSGQSNLFTLACANNQLTTLDVSATRCLSLICSNNALTSLNVANTYNNTVFAIAANNNPALACVQVDDAAFSTANWTDTNFVFDAGVSFSVDCTLGTGDFSDSAAFSIYPNPTESLVYFSEQMNVQLFTITGQLIANKQRTDSFDLSQQPSGVYLMVFTDPDGNIVQRSKVVKE